MAEPDLHPLEAAQRQRARILSVIRMATFVLLLTVPLLFILQGGDASGPRSILETLPWWLFVTIAVGLFALAMAIDVLTPNKKIATISGVFFGSLVGLLATVVIALLMRLVLRAWLDEQAYEAFAPFQGLVEVLVGITMCYLGISMVLQTQDDFRLMIPYVEFSRQIRGSRPLLIDSSALIDARVADIAATGIIQAPIVIPRFIVAELQLLADSPDKMRRTRGRRGLDIIANLQRLAGLDVSLDNTPVPGKAVDAMLVELAKVMTGRIVTTDSALSRVATIQDVPVINVNDLANALKPSLIPGEHLRIHIVREGEQEKQGVGYLEDGTMVVVDGGASMIGEDVDTEVTSTLQTSAGRMIFAKLRGAPAAAPIPDVTSLPEEGASLGSMEEITEHASEDHSDADGNGLPSTSDDLVGSESPEAGAAEEEETGRPTRSPFPPKRPRKSNPMRNPRR